MTDIDALLAVERGRLAGVLDDLTPAGWDTPSLCAGWTVRHLTVHLLMPFELTVPGFLGRMVAARFDFDRLADRFATRETRTNAQLVPALRATATQRFNVPGSPPEAPLSHLVIHAEDVYRPLGAGLSATPEAAAVVLGQLAGPDARRELVPGLAAGVRLVATDADWACGEGPEVTATASTLITTLAGRPAALDELSGPGADRVRARLAGAPVQPGRGQ